MTHKKGFAHFRFLLVRALTRYRRDAVIIAVTAIVGLAVTGWILSRQVQFTTPSWFPGAPKNYEFTAQFEDASGLLPGTAQPVSVSGVEVGVVR